MSNPANQSGGIRPIRVGMVECRGRQNLECQELRGPFKLVFIRQGRLGLDARGEWIELQGGDALLISRNQRSRAAIAYPPDLVYFWLLFEAERSVLSIPRRAAVARPRRMADLFQLLLEDQESGRLESRSAIGLVEALFAETAAQVEGRPSEPLEMRHVREAESFIHATFRDEVSARDVAEALNLNADYLGRLFKKHVGRTLVEEIQFARLREARLRLLEGDDTVENVALSCGFKDAGYFRRVFRRAEGVPRRSFAGSRPRRVEAAS